ncbi:MAG: winged helix-turn-helix transcriptional regulator [bacterium]|nr:winged helix-turn-helix transcriptional regulator [bacterium]
MVLRKAFPNLRRKGGGGFGVLVGVVEGHGAAWDAAGILDDRTVGGGRGSSGGGQPRPRRWGTSKAQRARLAEVMAAVGSGHRMQILVKLLEGPATYRSLQKNTRLKSGPLYHHIAQLRLAGLVGPKCRDLYELTRGGRNLVLVVLTLPRLIQDRRPRPTPHGPSLY